MLTDGQPTWFVVECRRRTPTHSSDGRRSPSHEFGFEYNTDVQGDRGYLLRGTHDAEGVKALCERWGFGYEEYEADDEE